MYLNVCDFLSIYRRTKYTKKTSLFSLQLALTVFAALCFIVHGKDTCIHVYRFETICEVIYCVDHIVQSVLVSYYIA